MTIDRNLSLSKNEKIDKEIKLLLNATQQYYKKIIFNIVQMAIADIVLKIL